MIAERNKSRPFPYPYLDPKEVPNAISIWIMHPTTRRKLGTIANTRDSLPGLIAWIRTTLRNKQQWHCYRTWLFVTTKCEFLFIFSACSSSRKVSHEWLDILKGTIKQTTETMPPSPKTITAYEGCYFCIQHFLRWWKPDFSTIIQVWKLFIG